MNVLSASYFEMPLQKAILIEESQGQLVRK